MRRPGAAGCSDVRSRCGGRFCDCPASSEQQCSDSQPLAPPRDELNIMCCGRSRSREAVRSCEGNSNRRPLFRRIKGCSCRPLDGGNLIVAVSSAPPCVVGGSVPPVRRRVVRGRWLLVGASSPPTAAAARARGGGRARFFLLILISVITRTGASLPWAGATSRRCWSVVPATPTQAAAPPRRPDLVAASTTGGTHHTNNECFPSAIDPSLLRWRLLIYTRRCCTVLGRHCWLAPAGCCQTAPD